MTSHKHCLVCNSSDLKNLLGYEKHFLIKCSNCSFVFAKKIPTNKELELHYEGYGRNDYLSPITIKRYNDILDGFEKYKKTKKLLDVGCGIGYFLEIAIKRGWQVFGTEYTDEAIEICRKKGISMHKGVLNPENYEEESFDIITSFEVIEHINNPIPELKNFYKLLRKGGLVYLTTPNFNSLLRYRLKSEYNVICYPEHLSYYTPKTLKKVFLNTGFQKKKIETTGISLTRLKTSKGSSNEAFISKSSTDEKIRGTIEANKILQVIKKFVNILLTFSGKGDSLKGYFIKK